MKKTILVPITLFLMFGGAHAGQHLRVIGYAHVWEDDSHLAFEIGDTLVIDNNHELDALVQFRDATEAVILAEIVHNYSLSWIGIPTETRSVCVASSMSCFPAGQRQLPSLTEYGLMTLVLLVVLSGLWEYRKKRASAIG